MMQASQFWDVVHVDSAFDCLPASSEPKSNMKTAAKKVNSIEKKGYT
jgi:hypothetical protein